MTVSYSIDKLLEHITLLFYLLRSFGNNAFLSAALMERTMEQIARETGQHREYLPEGGKLSNVSLKVILFWTRVHLVRGTYINVEFILFLRNVVQLEILLKNLVALQWKLFKQSSKWNSLYNCQMYCCFDFLIHNAPWTASSHLYWILDIPDVAPNNFLVPLLWFVTITTPVDSSSRTALWIAYDVGILIFSCTWWINSIPLLLPRNWYKWRVVVVKQTVTISPN